MNIENQITPDPIKAKKLFASYLIGFVLSLVLSLVAYAIVVKHTLSNSGLYIALTVFVVLALFVQVIFYFRLNTKTQDDRWNLICFLFTILIMAIVVSGSLWIMYNLNYYMVN